MSKVGIPDAGDGGSAVTHTKGSADEGARRKSVERWSAWWATRPEGMPERIIVDDDEESERALRAWWEHRPLDYDTQTWLAGLSRDDRWELHVIVGLFYYDRALAEGLGTAPSGVPG